MSGDVLAKESLTRDESRETISFTNSKHVLTGTHCSQSGAIRPTYGLKLLRRVCLRTGSFGLELQPESVGLSVNWTAGVRAELRSASLRAVWRVTGGEEISALADLLRVEDIDEFELGKTD